MEGMMTCLISGEGAETRDLGEVLLENGTATGVGVEFVSFFAGLPLTRELCREAGV